jgi:multidrug efflux system outer membrane protein
VSGTVNNAVPTLQGDTFRAPLDLTWELDLFGRVRRLNESARADAAGAAATFESFRLTLTADVAVNYFSLRAIDREWDLVQRSVDLRRQAATLLRARFDHGSAPELDVSRAETELAVAEAESAALAQRRASLQNALAVLVGENAPQFALPAQTDLIAPPVIPVGLPGELLERRPDIAAAERALASASARIGVAKAAFFPAISLTGSAGYASGQLDQLFDWGSRAWSVGPSLYLPIFQGGRNRANLARSRAAYDEAVAQYRQRVLIAFREVQDALTATRLLIEQHDAQTRAVTNARRSADLSQRRYDAGYVSYLEVVDAQRTALQVERAEVQVSGQRLINSIALIKALGGGWSATASSPTTVALR